MAKTAELSFTRVDELAHAARQGAAMEALPSALAARGLGPLLEAMRFSEDGLLPPVDTINLANFADLVHVLRGTSRAWVSRESGRQGFLRLGSAYTDAEDTNWTGFGLKLQQALEREGLAHAIAGQILGATKELHSNIYEHSEKPRTGLVAFAVHDRSFEFVVTDRGRGVLDSLRTNPAHANLASHGEAIRLALQTGVSRHAGDPLRGMGFDRMLTGLANLNCALRFRSGDGAVTLDPGSRHGMRPVVRQRPPLQGFFVSVQFTSPVPRTVI